MISNGTVKWFNKEKGYGFIELDSGSRDVFIHISVIKACGLEVLIEGQRVEIASEENDKGIQATKIEVE